MCKKVLTSHYHMIYLHHKDENYQPSILLCPALLSETLLQHWHPHLPVVKPGTIQHQAKRDKQRGQERRKANLERGISGQFTTCSTFSAFSQPLPAITSLMDPALTLAEPAPPLDLLTAAFAWWDEAERSASAFHKLKVIRPVPPTNVWILDLKVG